MASVQFLERVGRWSELTRVAYGVSLGVFAKSFGVSQPDEIVAKIKVGELDVYDAFDKFTGILVARALAPKTIHMYVAAVKSYLRHEGVEVDNYQLRIRAGVPPNMETSLDRIPTHEELRRILLACNTRARALIALLASSGLRIGEAGNLRVGNLDLLGNKVTVVAARSKSRRTRVTFITDETARFLREYLGQRINSKDEWLFPRPGTQEHLTRNSLYGFIQLPLMKLGLRQKLDPSSFMHELHPHSFRKYFFTKLIGAGVDRGVAEYLMGHKFGLDNAYLRMDEERLRKEYMKAADDFVFLTDRKLDRESKERVDQLQEQLKKKDMELIATNERLARLEGKFETAFEKKITNAT